MSQSVRNLKPKVLSLYRRILKLSIEWPQISKSSKENALKESAYIKEEARILFRQNAHLKDEGEILKHIHEGESRIELAMHYGTPYPRLINLPQNTLAATFQSKKLSQTKVAHLSKRTERALLNSTPSYLKSYQHKPKGSK